MAKGGPNAAHPVSANWTQTRVLGSSRFRACAPGALHSTNATGEGEGGNTRHLPQLLCPKDLA